MFSLRCIFRVGLAVGVFALPLFALIDQDGDGVSDVWSSLHPTAGAPEVDPDGDGQSNAAEATAGTDPTSSVSRFAATPQFDPSGNLVLCWTGVNGKYYRVDSSPDLRTWVPDGGEYIGVGIEISTIVRTAGTTSPDRQFWRVIASDFDSDDDGLNNWEEAQLGTNTNYTDSDDDLMPDGWEVAHGLNPLLDDSNTDPDADGAPNWCEFTRGTLPEVADPFLPSPPYLVGFESGEGYVLGGLAGQNNWTVLAGVAEVQAATDAPAGECTASVATSAEANWDLPGPLNGLTFVDFHACLGATDDKYTTAAICTGGFKIALVATGAAAEVWTGTEGSWYDENHWNGTGCSLAMDANSRTEGWHRYTMRLDFKAAKMDLYVDGGLVAFDRFGPAKYLSALILRANQAPSCRVDLISIGTANPLWPDADDDGMPDSWEQDHGLDPSSDDRDADPDQDGLSNIEESTRGTDPGAMDTDGDGVADRTEIENALDPKVPMARDPAAQADADGDGLTNLREYELGTDVLAKDSDYDGLADGAEVNQFGTNPLGMDSDNDGLWDGWEVDTGGAPLNPDTDGDGIPDGQERDLLGRSPDGGWFTLDYLLADTDANGIPDGQEDYDQDGVTILQELALELDPNHSDTDGDGVTDGTELALGSNPKGRENWADRDSDGDGLGDFIEIAAGTNPFAADSNANGMSDFDEFRYGGTPAVPGLPPPAVPDGIPTPERPSDAPRVGATPLTASGYSILVECSTIAFPKYGYETFQPLDPAERYLTRTSKQQYCGSTGFVESGPLGISGSRTDRIDPETGDESSAGDGYVSSFGDPLSPICRSGMGAQTGYDDPPNQTADGTASYAGTSVLSDENTTDMLLANGKAQLPEFVDAFAPGTPEAYRNVHANELEFDYQKVRCKFAWDASVPAEARHPIQYWVIFRPEDAPDTPEDESATGAEVCDTILWDGTGNESPVFTIDPDALKPDTDGTYSLATGCIGVDTNRDGVISLPSEDNSDVTSITTPFRFWLNDDDDHFSSSTGGGDTYKENAYDELNSTHPNYLEPQATSARDLEDFARLWISTQGLNAAFKNGDLYLGLKWSDVGKTGSPAIKVFKHAEADGGLGYLSSMAVASQQISQRAIFDARDEGLYADDRRQTIQGSDVFVLPTSVFSQLSETAPTTHLLFEGAGVGKGELKLIILKKDGTNFTTIGEGPGVWLDLKNLKSMYERVKATADGAENFPFPYNFVGGNAVPSPVMGWVSDPCGYVFEPASDENSTYIVFVHGWNQEYASSTVYAETMFKRLWHRGYKGRFVRFRWPTFTGLTTYNDSEYRAWKCGASLKEYLGTLPSSFTINLVAHSMGNIVAGSALEKGAFVANYALCHAAVPAICYDTSGSVTQSGWGYVTPNDDPDPATVALSYQGRLANVSGNLVNFFLPADSALGAWELNNDSPEGGRFALVGSKPHQWPEGSLDRAGYWYQRAAISGQKLRVVREEGNRTLAVPGEAMAFAVQASSLAVGAEGRTRGSVAECVDLSTYGFDSVHSAEFLFTVQQTRDFYGMLLLKFGVAIQP